MKKIVVFLFITISISISAQNNQIISKIYKAGTELGVGGSAYGIHPSSLMAFSNSPYVGIRDRNFNFIVLDRLLNEILRIPANKDNEVRATLYSSPNAKINILKEVIGYPLHGPLAWVNLDGTLKYQLEIKELNCSLDNNIFWIYRDYVLFYYYSGEPGMIDGQGKILTPMEVKNKMLDFQAESFYMQNPDLKSKLIEFLKNNTGFLCGLFYYPIGEFDEKTEKYVNLLQFLRKEYKINDDFDITKYKDNIYYQMTDYHGNFYFQIDNLNNYSEYEMYIFNKYGKMIHKYESSQFTGSISPWGDTYRLGYNEEKKEYTLIQFKNTWDPITNEEVDAWVKQQQSLMTQPTGPAADTTQPGKAVIKKLSASSTLTEPNDKNAYHPVKAFDNNPDTMWLVRSFASCSPKQPGFEAVDGPGIGESLEVEFSRPITANDIVIQPGCFMKAYWEQNNRLKDITIYLDDKKIKASFSDQMKAQVVRLDEVMTFSKARFVIDSVSKTTKWDDTPISDIWFLVNDEKVEIDLGEYAGVLKN